jgi:UDP-perosamine 4-acetyltransferase
VKKKKIIIIGAGQFGALVSRIIIKLNNYEILGFIDSDPKKKIINKIKVLGNDKQLKKYKKKGIGLVLAIGDIDKRLKLIEKLKRRDFFFPKIIAYSNKIDETTKIGMGSIITNHSVILNHCKVGKFCLIGSAVKILHNVNISKNCVIGGGSTIGSNVKIKDNVFIGVGSTIASKKIIIGSNAFICSGSGVFKDVKNNSKIIGNPGRVIPKSK